MKFITVLAILSGALAVPTYGEGSTGVSYGQPGGSGYGNGGNGGSYPVPGNGNNPGGNNGGNPGDNGNNPGDDGNNPGGDNGNNPGGDGNNPGGDNGNGGGDQGSGAPLCSSGLYSQPQCCATDVLGLADLDCEAPTGQVSSPDEFKASCGAKGSEAKCCVLPVLGQSVLCQDPL